MKRFQLLSGDEVIGETDLEMHDQGMNVYSGRLFASRGYDQVRAVFKAFSDAQDLIGTEKENALADYFKRRDRLRPAIRNRNGRRWEAHWINVNDFDEALDDLQVEVAAKEALDDGS